MAYGTRYRFEFISNNGVNTIIDIEKKNYSGAVDRRHLGRAPLLRQEQNDHIHGTSLTLWAECYYDGEFAELYTSAADEYRLTAKRGNLTIFQGFVSPELYSEPDIAPPYDVEITATDCLGELKFKTPTTYFRNGYDCGLTREGFKGYRDKLTNIITRLLTLTGSEWNYTKLWDYAYLYAFVNNATYSLIGDTYLTIDPSAHKTCYDLLQSLLTSINADIVIREGKPMIIRQTDNSSLLIADNAVAYGAARTHTTYPIGQMTSVVEPAKNQIIVESPINLRPLPVLSTTWVPSCDVMMIFKGYAAGGEAMERSIGIAVTDQLNRTWNLTKDGTWTRDALTEEQRITITVNSQDRNNPSEVQVYVPITKALALSDITSLQRFGLPFTDLFVFKDQTTFIPMSSYSGYRDTINLNNGSRNALETIESILVRGTSTDDRYASQMVYNYLGYSDTTNGDWSILNLASTISGQQKDALQFIALDYAKMYAAPRLRKTGKLNVPSSSAYVPMVYTNTHEQTSYFVNTYEFDLLNDEVTVDMMSFPSAAVSVESETVTPTVAGSSTQPSGSSSSGGSSSGGGGGGGTTVVGGISSVGLEAQSPLSVVGSPLTSNGTMRIELDNGYDIPTQTQIQGWTTASASAHGHENKTVLDTIKSQNITNWNSAVGQAHSHNNKQTIDNITSTQVTNWNAAAADRHSHANLDALETVTADVVSLAHGHENKTVLDGINQNKVNQWDGAFGLKHEHGNKTVLDGITANDIANWNNPTIELLQYAAPSVVLKKGYRDTERQFVFSHPMLNNPTAEIVLMVYAKKNGGTRRRDGFQKRTKKGWCLARGDNNCQKGVFIASPTTDFTSVAQAIIQRYARIYGLTRLAMSTMSYANWMSYASSYRSFKNIPTTQDLLKLSKRLGWAVRWTDANGIHYSSVKPMKVFLKGDNHEIIGVSLED